MFLFLVLFWGNKFVFPLSGFISALLVFFSYWYPFSIFVMFFGCHILVQNRSISFASVCWYVFVSTTPSCWWNFLSLKWNVLFCPYCFTLCRYFFNLPSFASAFLFISSSCFFFFWYCIFLFVSTSSSVFLFFFLFWPVFFYFSAFPIEFPILLLFFFSCLLRRSQLLIN